MVELDGFVVILFLPVYLQCQCKGLMAGCVLDEAGFSQRFLPQVLQRQIISGKFLRDTDQIVQDEDPFFVFIERIKRCQFLVGV